MKGVMLTRFPEARIIDLTHEILVHWPAEAGFWLHRSYRSFPVGTVHVAVVDPGVGTGREVLAAEVDEHLFVAPDNGLLAPLLDRHVGAHVVAVDLARPELRLGAVSDTFHGRDVFAPIAAELASGRLRLDQLGKPKSDWVPSWLEEPTLKAGEVTGRVLTFDNFGNIITNIDGESIASFGSAVVRIAGREILLRRTYGEVAPGDYVALVNAFGVVEVARAEDSAAVGLRVERGAPVSVATKS
jgi:S-adenosylmethionine hydrolase